MNQSRDYSQYLTRRSPFSLIFRRSFIRDLTRSFSGRVLDIGTGAGEFSRAYPDSIGVEINPYLAISGKQKGLKISLATIFSLPFHSQEFDGVLVSNVLEHLDDPQTGLYECARVLKPGGKLVVTVPFRAGFHRDRTHRTFIRKNDLHRFASGCHLRPVSIYSYPLWGAFFGYFVTFFELRAIFTK